MSANRNVANLGSGISVAVPALLVTFAKKLVAISKISAVLRRRDPVGSRGQLDYPHHRAHRRRRTG